MDDEAATVFLNLIEVPPDLGMYLSSEQEPIDDEGEDLALVSLRVRVGRDAFPIRVLLDRRTIPDDDLLAEARKRALVMLRAAIRALEAQGATAGSPGGSPRPQTGQGGAAPGSGA